MSTPADKIPAVTAAISRLDAAMKAYETEIIRAAQRPSGIMAPPPPDQGATLSLARIEFLKEVTMFNYAILDDVFVKQ